MGQKLSLYPSLSRSGRSARHGAFHGYGVSSCRLSPYEGTWQRDLKSSSGTLYHMCPEWGWGAQGASSSQVSQRNDMGDHSLSPLPKQKGRKQPRPAGVKLESASESPAGLVPTQLAGPLPEHLIQGFCIFNKVPDDTVDTTLCQPLPYTIKGTVSQAELSTWW